MENIHEMLEKIKSGEISVEEAELFFKKRPFEDIGYAKVDTHRKIRNGAYEVIYGAGKTADQIAGIIRTMADSGQERILITRMDPDKAKKVKSKLVGQIGFNDLANQTNADSYNKTIKIDYHEEAYRDYNAFYKDEYHDYEDAARIINYNVEGMCSFKSLMFIKLMVLF